MQQIKIYTRVLFGMKSLECLRFGICQFIFTDGDDDLIMSRSAVAELSIHNGIVTLQFKRKTIGAINQHYFANGVFVIGEDFTVPSAICKILGADKTVLLRGAYSTEMSEAYCTVVIKTSV